MAVILKKDKNHFPVRSNIYEAVDEGLITSGNMAFASATTLTTASATGLKALHTLGKELVHPDALYLLAIEKPGSPGDSAGDLTVRTYNNITVDGTSARDCLHTTHTVEWATPTTTKTYRDFIVQGLFMGNGTKLDFAFATDVASAFTVYYRIYRL